VIGGVASVHLATSCNHLTTRLVSYSFDVFTFFRDARSKKNIVEGSLEVKLPTIWTDEKQRWEESEKRRE